MPWYVCILGDGKEILAIATVFFCKIRIKKNKESSNSLDSNRERVAFSIFLMDLISVTREK